MVTYRTPRVAAMAIKALMRAVGPIMNRTIMKTTQTMQKTPTTMTGAVCLTLT